MERLLLINSDIGLSQLQLHYNHKSRAIALFVNGSGISVTRGLTISINMFTEIVDL